MRILFLLTQDLESPSGLGRYLPLAQELVKTGYQVNIAALHSNYQKLPEKHFQINGVDVNYVAPMHVKKSNSTKSYYSPLALIGIIVWSTWALTKTAFQDSADAIYIAKPHPMNSIAGVLAKFMCGKQIFLDCDDYEAKSNRFKGKWQQMFVALFEKHIPKFVRIITTNTHFMQEKLKSWGISEDKIIYLPNGIDPNRFPSPDITVLENLRGQHNLSNKRVIAYIGSISLPSHPIDLLFVAFKKILQNFQDAVLIIVGGGEDLATLQQLASQLSLQEHIHFIGRIHPENVHFYYGIADVTVDPVHDNDAARGRSPLKLFESWISGVPVVSADVGERSYLIGNPPAGVLVSPDQEGALTKGIAKVLSDADFAKSLSVMGKERVINFYWSNLAQILDDLFSVHLKANPKQ